MLCDLNLPMRKHRDALKWWPGLIGYEGRLQRKIIKKIYHLLLISKKLVYNNHA